MDGAIILCCFTKNIKICHNWIGTGLLQATFDLHPLFCQYMYRLLKLQRLTLVVKT